MKPLTLNRGLAFAVRCPNLDLKVSIKEMTLEMRRYSVGSVLWRSDKKSYKTNLINLSRTILTYYFVKTYKRVKRCEKLQIEIKERERGKAVLQAIKMAIRFISNSWNGDQRLKAKKNTRWLNNKKAELDQKKKTQKSLHYATKSSRLKNHLNLRKQNKKSKRELTRPKKIKWEMKKS